MLLPCKRSAAGEVDRALSRETEGANGISAIMGGSGDLLDHSPDPCPTPSGRARASGFRSTARAPAWITCGEQTCASSIAVADPVRAFEPALPFNQGWAGNSSLAVS